MRAGQIHVITNKFMKEPRETPALFLFKEENGMKAERKVEALKREVVRLKEQIEELKDEKQQAEKIIEGLHEQISRYMKADANERIRELEEGLEESKNRYQKAYEEAVMTQKKYVELMRDMAETRTKYENLMKEKIKNIKVKG